MWFWAIVVMWIGVFRATGNERRRFATFPGRARVSTVDSGRRACSSGPFAVRIWTGNATSASAAVFPAPDNARRFLSLHTDVGTLTTEPSTKVHTTGGGRVAAEDLVPGDALLTAYGFGAALRRVTCENEQTAYLMITETGSAAVDGFVVTVVDSEPERRKRGRWSKWKRDILSPIFFIFIPVYCIYMFYIKPDRRRRLMWAARNTPEGVEIYFRRAAYRPPPLGAQPPPPPPHLHAHHITQHHME